MGCGPPEKHWSLSVLGLVFWLHASSASADEVTGPSISLGGPLELRAVNGFWLVAPLLAFNVALAGRLPEPYFRRERVPRALLVLENVLRVPVFVAPLLLPLHVGDVVSHVGWASYSAGASAYLASWIAQTHFAHRPLSQSLAARLAPAFTPLFWLFGIALVSHAPAYAVLSAGFVAVHVSHFALVFGR